MNGQEADEISSLPTFSELAKVLRKYYNTNTNQDEFVTRLFDNILDCFDESYKENTEEQKKFCSYNPLRNTNRFSSDTLARYFSDKPIAKETYREMTKYLNHDNFATFIEKKIENSTDEADRDLVSFIKKYCPDADEDNYSEKYADVFEKIIQTGANATKQKAGRKAKIAYPEDTNASSMELLEDRINKAALAISKSIKAETVSPNPNITYCIRDKIKRNSYLCNRIESNLVYFNVVNEAFCSAAEKGGLPPTFIRKSVRRQYEKLKAKKLDTEAIINGMSIYFASFALLSQDAPEIEIIVSYFIQLCEVFDAPTR